MNTVYPRLRSAVNTRLLASLGSEFNNMKLRSTPAQKPRTATRALDKKHRDARRVKVSLPKEAIEKPESCIYGYAIDQAWLYRTAQRLAPEMPPGMTVIEAAAVTLDMLRRLTKMNLGYEYCIGDGVDAGVNPHSAPSAPPAPGEVTVILVLKVFTARRSSFRRRPSQEQMTALTAMMEREPMWWMASPSDEGEDTSLD